MKSEAREYRMAARQESVDETRERILEAMVELWLERHYDDVTLSLVAERAGVSRQTVHRQFGSKDDLLTAAAEWKAPQIQAGRATEPGDVEGAISGLVDFYEMMGDANVRTLAMEGRVPALDAMLKRGRTTHRGWIETVFEPFLPARGDKGRDPAVMALYAATDVMVWKLLRRDFGRSKANTEATMRTLVDGVLTRIQEKM